MSKSNNYIIHYYTNKKIELCNMLNNSLIFVLILLLKMNFLTSLLCGLVFFSIKAFVMPDTVYNNTRIGLICGLIYATISAFWTNRTNYSIIILPSRDNYEEWAAATHHKKCPFC